MTDHRPAWLTSVAGELLRGAIELETTDHGVLPHRLPATHRRIGHQFATRVCGGGGAFEKR